MNAAQIQMKRLNCRVAAQGRGNPRKRNFLVRISPAIAATTLLVLLGVSRLMAQAPAASGESPSAIVYVADTNGGISEVNSADNSVIATASFGGIGAATAITPDGKRFYVTDYLSANVTVFDASTNVPVAQVPVGSGTGNIGVAVTPDGSAVYVTSQFDGTVSVIATATNTVVKTISTGTEPVWVMISPDGSRAYVSNQASGTVSVIATATNQVVANIGGLGCPYGTRLARYGTQLLVADQCGNALNVANTATNTVIKSIPVGLTPKGVAVTADGEQAYVSDFGSNTLDVIDLTTLTNLETPITVGTNPRGLAVGPGGQIYVTNFGDVTVSVVDTKTNQVTATLRVRSGPADVTVSTTARPRILNYSFQAFDPPGSTNTVSRGINNVGQNVGHYLDSLGNYHGYLRQAGGTFVTLDAPGAGFTLAYGINDQGTIVGQWASSSTATTSHGFLRSPVGTYTTLDFPGATDTALTGINARGAIVGVYDLGDPTTSIGFIYENGTFTTIEDPSGPMQTQSVGISALNFVSGAYNDSTNVSHGFIRDLRGQFHNFDFPGADFTLGTKINDLGQVVGMYQTNFPLHGFVLNGAMAMHGQPSATQFLSFDYPDSQNTGARGINDRGQVAGTFHRFGDPASHGFIATPIED